MLCYSVTSDHAWLQTSNVIVFTTTVDTPSKMYGRDLTNILNTTVSKHGRCNNIATYFAGVFPEW